MSANGVPWRAAKNGKILISKMAKNGVTAAFVLDEVKNFITKRMV